MFSLCCTFLLPFVIGIHASVELEAQILQNKQPPEEELVAAFLEALLEKLHPCVLLLAHDYVQLPRPFFQLMMAKQQQQLLVHLSIHPNITNGLYDGEYWFSWLLRPSAKPHGSCVVAAFIFHLERMTALFQHAANLFRLRIQKDYYVMWSKGSTPEQVFANPSTKNMMYKLAVTPHPAQKSVRLDSLCFFCQKGNQSVVHISDFVPGEDMGPVSQLYPEFNRDLHGRFLRCIFIEPGTPAEVKGKLSRGEPVLNTIRFISELGDSAHYDWTVEVYDLTGPAEIRLDNGTWTGMSGGVLYENYDVGVVTAYSWPMMGILGLTQTILYDPLSYLSRKPRPTYSWKAILEPYTPGMWGLIFLACMLSSVVFWTVFKMHSQATGASSFQPHQPPTSTMLYSIRFLFSTLIEENPNLLPSGDAPRAFLVFWWLFAMVITCGYDTKLFAFLVNPKYEVLPQTLQDLVFWKGWSWGLSKEQAPLLRVCIGDSELAYLHLLEPGMEVAEDFPACMALATQKDFSCISIASRLGAESAFLVDQEGYLPTTLHRDSTVLLLFGPIVAKFSVLQPLFETKVLEFWKSGLMAKLERDYFQGHFVHGLRDARARGFVYHRSMALKFTQLQGCIYFLVFFGWGFGLLLFFAEHCRWSMQRRQRTQDHPSTWRQLQDHPKQTL